MAHEIAKLLLEQAGRFLKREEAIRQAIALGMPLYEIEEYLDWLDVVRQNRRARGVAEEEPNPTEEDSPDDEKNEA